MSTEQGVFRQLLKPGFYLRKTKNLADTVGYKLYDKDVTPYRFITEKAAARIVKVCKRDSKGKLYAAPAKIRALHGNNSLRRAYIAWVKTLPKKVQVAEALNHIQDVLLPDFPTLNLPK